MDNDLISRQALMKEFSDFVRKSNNSDFAPTPTWNDAVSFVASMPSAETERKTGHWIEITSSNHTYKCSVCGRLLVNITDGKNNVAKNYPYCHCGADMRGKENE